LAAAAVERRVQASRVVVVEVSGAPSPSSGRHPQERVVEHQLVERLNAKYDGRVRKETMNGPFEGVESRRTNLCLSIAKKGE